MAGPRVLLSRQVLTDLGPAFRAATAGCAWEAVALEDIGDDDTQTVDAAFISRDITGLSSKTVPAPALAQCWRVLRRSPQLAWVHTHSAGADRPIYSEVRARGTTVTTSSGANAGTVAQTALAGLLALARRFPALLAAQAEGRWAPLVAAGPLPRDLAGQIAVLVGWGPIARRLQPHLTLLGMQVQVVRHSAEPAGPGLPTVTYAGLHTVLPQADWLLLCCPLTAQTRGLVDAQALARLPAGAQLVNVARGEVVDEAALVQALRSGRLAGAYLDVFDVEPLPAASPLWALPGVIVTPHCAGQSDSHAANVAAMFTDNLGRWLRGEALAHVAA